MVLLIQLLVLCILFMNEVEYMSKESYIGVDGTAKKIQKCYIGVDGKARKVKKIYIGINGVAKLCASFDN